MAFDFAELLFGKLTRLEEHRVRHADLADVVEDRRLAQTFDLSPFPVQLVGDRDRKVADAHRMAAGETVLGVDRPCQRRERRQPRRPFELSRARDLGVGIGDVMLEVRGLVPPRLFRPVQRLVGSAPEFDRIVVLRGQIADPRRRRQTSDAAERRLEGRPTDTVDHGDRVGPHRVRNDDRELLAPGAGDEVAVANLGGESTGKFDQDRVTCEVPVRVIDVLEVIDVQ